MYYEYDFGGAERACKRAIELNPNSSQAHQIYARYLASRGRFDEAITEARTAIDLEPASLFNQRIYGTILYYARRYPEAVAQLKRVIEMDKNFGTTYGWLISSLELQGNESEAFEWQMKLLSLEKADEETVQTFKIAYQASGWRGVVRERAKRIEKKNNNYFYIAEHHARSGDKDDALEYLEKSYQQRELWMAYLQVEPHLDPLRGDPRYAALARRVESK
jgi:tetratricopeptide (TPR) repeat protein